MDCGFYGGPIEEHGASMTPSWTRNDTGVYALHGPSVAPSMRTMAPSMALHGPAMALHEPYTAPFNNGRPPNRNIIPFYKANKNGPAPQKTGLVRTQKNNKVKDVAGTPSFAAPMMSDTYMLSIKEYTASRALQSYRCILITRNVYEVYLYHRGISFRSVYRL